MKVVRVAVTEAAAAFNSLISRLGSGSNPQTKRTTTYFMIGSSWQFYRL
jgi:hypothetical protein